jgi:micrococcal nuclease
METFGKPLIVMIFLITIVFFIRSPIFTWLTPPVHIKDLYYLDIKEGELAEYGLVTHVSDGDTFTLDDSQEVRMLGMDTPELAHPDIYIREECFGKDAKARLEQLILHKKVFLLKDGQDKDAYDRSLRFVFLADKNIPQRKLLVNAYMIGEGFARAYIFKQDEKFKEFINSLQTQAMKKKAGLWGKCDREKFRW